MNTRLTLRLMAGVALATLPGLGAAAPSVAAPAPAPLAAPAKAATFGDPTFERVWNRTDLPVAAHQTTRTWFWGPAPATMMSETYLDAPDGSQQRLVQYFDKSRMEINNPAGNPNDPFYVTNGLLTVELISGNMQIGNTTFETRRPADIPDRGRQQRRQRAHLRLASARSRTSTGRSRTITAWASRTPW